MFKRLAKPIFFKSSMAFSKTEIQSSIELLFNNLRTLILLLCKSASDIKKQLNTTTAIIHCFLRLFWRITRVKSCISLTYFLNGSTTQRNHSQNRYQSDKKNTKVTPEKNEKVAQMVFASIIPQ